MKTGITVTELVQTGMDSWKDLKMTKGFDDNATLLEIKQWIKMAREDKRPIEEISIAVQEISDVKD